MAGRPDGRLAPPFWATPAADLLRELGARDSGLTDAEAAARLARVGRIATGAGAGRLRVLFRQLRSPLQLLLVFAAIVAAATGAWAEGAMVVGIVTVSVWIGYAREYQAHRAAAALAGRLRARALVRRDGRDTLVERDAVVPGDLVVLSAGSLVPADGIVLTAADLFVSESALTGESFPVEKRASNAPGDDLRASALFLGSDVRSGAGVMPAVRTGADTDLGAVAGRLTRPAPESDFDRGLRRFGYFLTVLMLMLVIVIVAAHLLRGRDVAETLLFSIALAVGLSPELMPAILTVNLARGAGAMAARGVLVRRLNAIENLGSMDVLCTDKTGTLTEGVIELDGSFAADGSPSDLPRALARTNAAFSTGAPNPLDQALLSSGGAPGSVTKVAEIPFDFVRRRVSVVVTREGEAGDVAEIITKGSVGAVLAVASDAGGRPLDAAARARIESLVAAWSGAGMRVVAVASRRLTVRERYTREDETELELRGFLTFLDRPKPDAARAIADLRALNVDVKLITGDHHLVAAHVAGQVGLRHASLVVGADADAMDDAMLWRASQATDVFAEVTPAQKERILLSLKRHGHVVGFLGDGVNDAPAMHVADTSMSVDGAVDVAREAADFVLLERDLDVIRGGIEEGRRTFVNTRKYILLTMSANLGNMLSMATASLFLPFLPMTAAQILLTNLLSDLPAFGLATDSIDAAALARPPRWDVRLIGAFMIEFGLISCLFDLLTFAMLLRVFHAAIPAFQTGWFVESLLTELVVALVIRTEGPCYRSRPAPFLLWATAAVTIATIGVPYLPGAAWLGLVPLPWTALATLVTITIAYAAAVEVAKVAFYRRRARR